MDDRLFFALTALVVVAMISLAALWPQGLGTASAPPFGRTMVRSPVHPGAAGDASPRR